MTIRGLSTSVPGESAIYISLHQLPLSRVGGLVDMSLGSARLMTKKIRVVLPPTFFPLLFLIAMHLKLYFNWRGAAALDYYWTVWQPNHF